MRSLVIVVYFHNKLSCIIQTICWHQLKICIFVQTMDPHQQMFYNQTQYNKGIYILCKLHCRYVCLFVCLSVTTQTDAQTDTKVNTEDTLSGFQDFFLQPVIKVRSNNITLTFVFISITICGPISPIKYSDTL